MFLFWFDALGGKDRRDNRLRNYRSLRCFRDDSQMSPKWSLNDTQMTPKWSPNAGWPPKWHPNGNQMTPKWCPADPNDTQMTPKWSFKRLNIAKKYKSKKLDFGKKCPFFRFDALGGKDRRDNRLRNYRSLRCFRDYSERNLHSTARPAGDEPRSTSLGTIAAKAASVSLTL